MENKKTSSQKMAPSNRMQIGGGHMRGMMAGKPKNFKQSIKKLFKLMSSYKVAVIISIIFTVFATIVSLYGPNRIQDITDMITGGIVTGVNTAAVIDIAILLGCLYIVSAVFGYFEGFLMAGVTTKIVRKLRKNVSEKINKLPLKYFDNSTIGDTLSRATNDVGTIAQTVNQSFVQLISAVLMFVGCVIVMFFTNWIMAITAVVSTLLGFVIMFIVIRKTQKHFMAQQVSLGVLNGQIEETYSGHEIIQAYNAEKQVSDDFNKTNTKLFNSAWKSQFFSGLMMPLMGFIGNFGYLCVAVVGGALAFNGMISLGIIAAFMIYVRLFSQPLSQMAQSFTSLQGAAAASERVFEFLEEKEMQEETISVNSVVVKGDISFQNVKFGYSEDKTVINNFSIDVKAGQKVAIVGPTGAGKTTLVNLLMKFYQVDSGSIKIDGININDMTREQVHDAFAMVLQDTWLFEGTIKDNIIYNVEGATLENVEKASQAVGLNHYVQTLPDGYNTVISDGADMSAGQRQLVTIARAMVKDAPLLILDEATSSVDTRTERIVQNAMDKLMHGRTSFIIAHRLSTIKNADIIIVMRQGDIVESGSHEQLLKKGGFYAELYNSQFEEE